MMIIATPNTECIIYSNLMFCCITVCHLLRGGVAAIFGPQNAQTASHVQSICDTMEIPHLETRWDWRQRRQSCLVNLYPHPTTLSKVRTRTSGIIASLKRHPPRKICLRGLPLRFTDFLPLSWLFHEPFIVEQISFFRIVGLTVDAVEVV